MHAGYVGFRSLIMLSILPKNHHIEKRLLRYVCVAWHAGYVCYLF